MERTVLEESWRRNGPVGLSREVIDGEDNTDNYKFNIMIGLLCLN
jgi:hypothetical protein